MTPSSETEIQLLTPAEVAKLLRTDPATLAKWRCERRRGRRGGALPFVKNGDGPNARVLYRMSDIKAFIEARVTIPVEQKTRRGSATVNARGSR